MPIHKPTPGAKENKKRKKKLQIFCAILIFTLCALFLTTLLCNFPYKKDESPLLTKEMKICPLGVHHISSTWYRGIDLIEDEIYDHSYQPYFNVGNGIRFISNQDIHHISFPLRGKDNFNLVWMKSLFLLFLINL